MKASNQMVLRNVASEFVNAQRLLLNQSFVRNKIRLELIVYFEHTVYLYIHIASFPVLGITLLK